MGRRGRGRDINGPSIGDRVNEQKMCIETSGVKGEKNRINNNILNGPGDPKSLSHAWP